MKKYIEEYRSKRDFVYSALREHFEVVKPSGAFYIFPKVPFGSDLDFVRAALEKKVLIVPGNACSQKNTHFRLSYAAPDDTLKRGIEILCGIAKM
jgi:aspartate aminotransferase/aminotransferase